MDILCILLSLVLHGAYEQNHSVRAIEKVYGMVLYDYQLLKNGDLDDRATSPLPTWMTRGLGRHIWHSVVFLDLDSELVTDETLAELRGLGSLEVLHISNTSITGEGLAALGELPELRVLTLNTNGITDHAIKAIAENCSSLQELQLFNTEVTKAGLAHLKKLPTLRRLVLDTSSVTEEDVVQLQKLLPNCQIEVL